MEQMKSRIVFLDPIRFFLAFSVVLYHYCFRGGVTQDKINIDFPATHSIAQYGFLGVQCFFMISGLVIFYSVTNKSALEFFKSRVLRLMPAFWVCCTLTYFIESIFLNQIGESGQSLLVYLRNMTMLEGFIKREYIDGVYWTLTVEIIFYSVLFFYLISGAKSQVKIFRLIYFWVLLSFINHFLELNDMLTKVLILDYIPYFFAGMLCVISMKNVGMFTYFSGTALSIFMIFNELSSKVNNLNHRFDSDISLFFCFFIVLFFYFFMFFMLKYNIDIKKKRLYFYLGALTYPLYLVHQDIGYILIESLASVGKYTALLISLIIVLALSIIVSEFLEKKIRKTLNKLLEMIYTKI